MSGTGARWFAFVESNTTGTGRDFCAAARARGLRPVLLTRDPGRYGYVAEDGVDTVVLDTSDADAVYEECAALARGAGLAGVTSSSEYYVVTAARTAAKLGLPAPDADAVARCRAKDVQRALLADAGVPVPRFAAVGEVADAVAAAEDIGHPVVLKPVSGSGSVGVKLCRDRAETTRWARELLGRATDERGTPVPSRILVEAAVEGPEFSVETFDDHVVTVVGKHLGPEPYFVETGHDVPAPAGPAALAALGDTARAALAALGLGWGAAHTELRLSASGPVVIEVNPRLAGGMIPVAVRAATGRDLVDEVIARAAGQDAPAAGPAAGHAAIRFLLATGTAQDPERRVSAVEGLERAAAAPRVVAAATTGSATIGRTLRVTHSFQDRLACVVATGGSGEEAERHALDAARLIRIGFQQQAAPQALDGEGVGGR
ncbi:ATP-grasp domain-containing protein [Streptomyces sp. NPDC005898]|uniref:ATP-grasp domain-containing protein n=1 Tax=Streptomyces sp. NPDC005898 TaxID=3157082 RepID=UPI0033F54DF0